jgi:hypothetical protein
MRTRNKYDIPWFFGILPKAVFLWLVLRVLFDKYFDFLSSESSLDLQLIDKAMPRCL